MEADVPYLTAVEHRLLTTARVVLKHSTIPSPYGWYAVVLDFMT